jgi:hypothetical protein
VKPLHELTDEGLENLIWSIASEKMRRKTISERCRFFKYGKCSDGYKCKPNKKCWEK